MHKVKSIEVYYEDRLVGTMALYRGMLAAFEYSYEWLKDGFSISPFSLPLEQKVFIPRIDPCDGLFGVFSDSLPDGWGRLLVDRLMKKKGMNPYEIGNLDRLAIVGASGMGALTYRPVIRLEQSDIKLSLDEIAQECKMLLETNEADQLDYLFKNGGSSGGARPKILTKVDGEDWIIKFPSSDDGDNMGRQEYEYAICAKTCGIEMEEVCLFPSKVCDGYFGTKRFDRRDGRRIHMVTAAGLLETSHRIPNLDYDLLMKLTLQLTHTMDECEKLYRRMCFNVFAHNRDDHSKNFTYQYFEKENCWKLSPAYDLTFSYSIGGEHATTIHGNGNNPGIKDLLEVAKGIGISKPKAKSIAEDIRCCVEGQLGEYIKR